MGIKVLTLHGVMLTLCPSTLHLVRLARVGGWSRGRGIGRICAANQ